ncbi:unnamed protein product [Bursaphelenchus okinawaensis]|uniref:Uncharacterized protein n=1 Tax=Bursaphelenchus okinawaensis TaxID=465554 RepID=A0A811KBI6_9BILA|nr:unnamed protein product [Bursaphelenchus okinawaensis]CAG9099273.1 unnamed protein product [Bursaphelenchus okinawaensis]
MFLKLLLLQYLLYTVNAQGGPLGLFNILTGGIGDDKVRSRIEKSFSRIFGEEPPAEEKVKPSEVFGRAGGKLRPFDLSPKYELNDNIHGSSDSWLPPHTFPEEPLFSIEVGQPAVTNFKKANENQPVERKIKELFLMPFEGIQNAKESYKHKRIDIVEQKDDVIEGSGTGSKEDLIKDTNEDKKLVEVKNVLDLINCFMQYGRENEKLGFCFGGEDRKKIKPFYLAARSNKDLENECSGAYNLSEYIKERSIHKKLFTNKFHCSPSHSLDHAEFRFHDFERGAIQIVQQWKLINSTQNETQKFTDESQRYTEVVKVNTEIYGLECVHFTKTNDFWLMNENGEIFQTMGKQPSYQFRIDRLRADGEWGFPLKTDIQQLPLTGRFEGLRCSLRN